MNSTGGTAEGHAGPEPTAARAPLGTVAILRALLIAIVVGATLAALVVCAAAIIGGDGALAGAGIGAGLSLVVTVPTLISARIGAPRGAAGFASVVLVAWLVKMIVLVAVLIAVRGMSGISNTWIGVALLAGAVVPTVIEGLLLLRTRPPLDVRR